MSNSNIENIKNAIRSTINWNKPLAEIRKDLQMYDEVTPLPQNVQIEKISVNNSKVELIIPDQIISDDLLVYVHGGGFCLGIVNTNRAFVCQIAIDLGMKTMLLDYRLAPENPYPSGLTDFINFYVGLIEIGYAPKKINIMADSSGCGLALSGLQKLISNNIELPKALALISPVVDFARTGESFFTKKRADPYNISDEYYIDNYYVKELNTKDPSISPIYGSFAGFPPMLIHAADCDVFLSDSQILHKKAIEQGVKVSYHQWEGLWHNFHMSSKIVPEGQEALAEIYEFLHNV